MLTRVAKIVLGVLLIVAGVVLGFLPVLPGWPLALIGTALVLSQSEPGRHLLKRVRLHARDRFGSDRVRQVESRMPSDVIGDEDTTQMRLDVLEYERQRQRQEGRRRRGRRGRGRERG